jgi:putative aldouronate transport system permease protein
MKKKNPPLKEILFQAVLYLIFGMFTLICLYPFYYILIYSLSNPSEAMRHNITWYPRGFTLDNYSRVLNLPGILSATIVSFSRTILGTVLATFFTTMFAFVLTRKDFILRKFFYRMTVATIYLAPGLIPWYITMKNLGLKDNYLLYILPYIIGAFNLILVKTYIEQLPNELQEAAEIDGANVFRIFIKIIFPISKPVLAAIILFTAVFHWNAWTDNFYLVGKSSLQTLQLTLLNYLREADNIAKSMTDGSNLQFAQNVNRTLTPTSIRMTLTMVVTLPILVIYPSVQKYFVKGILMVRSKDN